MNLTLHPSIGVARLGNSGEHFYLSPDSIGGLPYEADQYGNQQGTVEKFKDSAGQVRRQGQPFRIYHEDGVEITLETPGVVSIEWTVHLANKKAAWYQYSELDGNLLYGPENSYAEKGVEWRNHKVTGDDRQALIIDPGPRTVSGARQSVGFDKDNVPKGYDHAHYPPENPENGTPIKTLGNLLTDDKGRLIVLGGFGNAGGDEPLTSYGGSDTWHDDISDGPVYCTITFEDGSEANVNGWVIVGSPDYAPEIVNISALSDTMFDVGVRYFGLVPEMYLNGAYKESFTANYKRDILPIIQRLGRYQWVANIQPMMAFTSNIFDFTDNGEDNKNNRQNYFSYFRAPNDKKNPSPDQPQETLFRENGPQFSPMLPLNSGSNSVSNDNIVKFLALNETQYFLLGQWAKGNFVNDADYQPYPVNPQDMASIGNCVGLPMCPGIEVTWSVQNNLIYERPFKILDSRGKDGYYQSGLTPSRDECEGGGCEPGDLTKRMACPWQADFFQCTIQYINFTDPSVNKDNGVPKVPTYYAYWWPPQSPWDVLTGEFSKVGQEFSHLPSGQQVNYARGINSFVQMVEHWSALAFIRDNNPADKGFPYFTETERTNELFTYKEVPMGYISQNSEDDATTVPVFYIEENLERVSQKGDRAKKLVAFLESRSFKKIEVAAEGLPLPRSGTRTRR